MKETSLGGDRRAFEPTVWTVVLRARDRNEWNGLVERYWKPCYFYVRRRGHDVEDAKDLTQAFFADFLERDSLAGVRRAQGRFRSYLLACLDHFLSNEYDRRKAKKRDAPFDFASAESRLEDARADTPEKAFQRQWAVGVIERALAVLRQETGDHFDVLREYITSGRPDTLRDIAGRLRLTEANVKVILHRTRKRYREILRAEVARTVERPGEVQEELKEILAALV